MLSARIIAHNMSRRLSPTRALTKTLRRPKAPPLTLSQKGAVSAFSICLGFITEGIATLGRSWLAMPGSHDVLCQVTHDSITGHGLTQAQKPLLLTTSRRGEGLPSRGWPTGASTIIA